MAVVRHPPRPDKVIRLTPPLCSRIPESQLRWGGGMRERKGMQRMTVKSGDVRRNPRSNRAGVGGDQPREVRLVGYAIGS